MAIASSLPLLLAAQEGLPPQFLRDRALVVRFLAVAGDTRPQTGGARLQASPAASAQPGGSAWTSRSLRYTVSGSPVGIRLASESLVVLVQVTPYDHGKEGLVVVAQGQVWTRQEDGQIAYHSAFETLVVGYGERVFFYPLGIHPDGTAAFRLEIAVDHYGDPPSLPDHDGAQDQQQGRTPDSRAGLPSDSGQPAKRAP
jgi:hypothetical protein